MTAAQFDIAFALISQIYRVVAESRTAHPKVDVEVAELRFIFREVNGGWQALVLVGPDIAEDNVWAQRCHAYVYEWAKTVDAAFIGLVLQLNQKRAEAGL